VFVSYLSIVSLKKCPCNPCYHKNEVGRYRGGH
jgi:hypothetical protein